MNGWYFLATEVDDICFDYATKNVEQNNLSDLIKGACFVMINQMNVSVFMAFSICFVFPKSREPQIMV